MLATQSKFLTFIRKSTQFVIPIYQRNYSWEQDQCKQLWDDVLEAGQNSKIEGHFIGSVVYIERGLSAVTEQEPLLVIDGQQRLTTCTLLLVALARYFEENHIGEILDAFSFRKLMNYYLINAEEGGERRYKLILSETDKQTLLSLIESHALPNVPSVRIKENFKFFSDQLNNHPDELANICKGLAKLEIVDVALDRERDNPQLIFESMNSTGLALSEADLIRNYILMGLKPQLQMTLYNQYWHPMEKAFGQRDYKDHFDSFMRHYLIVKTKSIPKVDLVYKSFKDDYAKQNADISKIVEDIHRFAGYYCAIALDKNGSADPILKSAFQDFRELKVDVAYPLLLVLYDYYQQGKLKKEELYKAVRLIESYIFRRAVCEFPTNSLGKIFLSIIKPNETSKPNDYAMKFNEKNPLSSLEQELLTKGFPTDELFTEKLKSRDLYNFRNRTYWPRRLENHGRKERINPEDYTIEHIMPQKLDALSKEWMTELGENYESLHRKYVHTLGNLTLTAYNSEYSNKSFLQKRDLQDKQGNHNGFASSPLKLNQGLGQLVAWNQYTIEKRADHLAQEALKVWSRPLEITNTNHQQADSLPQPLSFNFSQPYIHPKTKEIFYEIDEQIQSLNINIKRKQTDSLKHKIIYFFDQADFAEITLHENQLSILLNASLTQIQDTKNKCTDISNIDTREGGALRIELASTSEETEINYVMNLIDQVLEQKI